MEGDLRLVRPFLYKIRECGKFWSGNWTAGYFEMEVEELAVK